MSILARSGPHRALVMVHGTRTSHTQFDPQRGALEEAGVTVITPDLPGHGDLLDGELTRELAIDAIHAALIHAADLAPRVHLYGHSLGGMLAIHAAATSPTALAGLIAAGCTATPAAQLARAYGTALNGLGRLPDAAFAALIGREGRRLFDAGGRASVATVRSAMAAVGGLDLLGDLRGLDIPVTLLNGRFDQFRIMERRFARASRRGRLVVLSAGGHLVNLTHPHLVTAALLEAMDWAEQQDALPDAEPDAEPDAGLDAGPSSPSS